jgi:hypothetical protein
MPVSIESAFPDDTLILTDLFQMDGLIRPRSVKMLKESVEMCDVVHTWKNFIQNRSVWL